MFDGNPYLLQAIASTVIAGLSTGIGALPVLTATRLSDRMISLLLGFGGGVMIAASAFSLVAPALELAQPVLGGTHGALVTVMIGILVGAFMIWYLERIMPHEHFFTGREGPDAHIVRRAWLFVAAIALHNLPEGLAVGVGYGTEDPNLGITVTTGIVLQNIPEGLVSAVALIAVGYSRKFALAVTFGTGLVETLGGLLGLAITSIATLLVPLGLAFAAGAMVYVVGGEVIPESHRRGFQRHGTWGFLIGFLIMTSLDYILR
jgi:ZIP family zinc transporter